MSPIWSFLILWIVWVLCFISHKPYSSLVLIGCICTVWSACVYIFLWGSLLVWILNIFWLNRGFIRQKNTQTSEINTLTMINRNKTQIQHIGKSFSQSLTFLHKLFRIPDTTLSLLGRVWHSYICIFSIPACCLHVWLSLCAGFNLLLRSWNYHLNQ